MFKKKFIFFIFLGSDTAIRIKKKPETESSSTETDQKVSRGKSRDNSLEKNRKRLHRKSSLNFEPVESLSRSNSQKAISKPLEVIKNNLVDSKSDSSSGSTPRRQRNEKEEEEEEEDNEEEVEVEERKATPERGRPEATEKAEVKQRVRCSPSVDLGTNPNVTFVSTTSIPDPK